MSAYTRMHLREGMESLPPALKAGLLIGAATLMAGVSYADNIRQQKQGGQEVDHKQALKQSMRDSGELIMSAFVGRLAASAVMGLASSDGKQKQDGKNQEAGLEQKKDGKYKNGQSRESKGFLEELEQAGLDGVGGDKESPQEGKDFQKRYDIAAEFEASKQKESEGVQAKSVEQPKKKKEGGMTHPAWQEIDGNKTATTEDLFTAIAKNGLTETDEIEVDGYKVRIEDWLREEKRDDVFDALKSSEKEKKDAKDVVKDDTLSNNVDIDPSQQVDVFKFKKKVKDKNGNKEEIGVETALLKSKDGKKNYQHVKSGNTSGFIDEEVGTIEATGKDELTFNYKEGGSIKVKDKMQDNGKLGVEFDLSNNISNKNLGMGPTGKDSLLDVKHRKGEKGEKGEKLDLEINPEKLEKQNTDNFTVKFGENDNVSFRQKEDKSGWEAIRTKDGKEQALNLEKDKDGHLKLSMDNPNFEKHKMQKQAKEIGGMLKGSGFQEQKGGTSMVASSAKQQQVAVGGRQ